MGVRTQYQRRIETEKLGCSHSRARTLLERNLLYLALTKYEPLLCFICTKEISRETFTIEHKVPWLNSSDPKHYFFSLDNISYSHKKCNVAYRGAPVPPEPTQRKCCICKEVKPMTEFYASKPRSKLQTKAYRALCKPCWKEYSKAYTKLYSNKNRVLQRNSKVFQKLIGDCLTQLLAH